MHRYTNHWFWGEFPSAAWEFTYTIKFLRSSITFPCSVTLQGFERRDDAGLHVELGTLASLVGSPHSPTVLWSRVSMGGRPFVGATMLARVVHEATGLAKKVRMLDDGSTGKKRNSEHNDL